VTKEREESMKRREEREGKNGEEGGKD